MVVPTISLMPNYAPLHTFLVGRLADRVVLTFAQMEDLLGCPLPADARTDPGWWAVPPGTTATEQSGFWTGADRTATANLLALTVLFERNAIPAGRQRRA
jgi:hypothetical protein